MPEDFPFKGVWIPAKVFRDSRLTQSDKFLWSIVHILSNAKGCFATRETLANYLDMSERNVQYGIGRLVECGYVRRAKDGTIWDILTLALEGEADCTSGVKGISPEGCKEFHPYRNKDIDTKDKKAQPSVDDSFIRSDPALSKVWDDYLEWRKGNRKPSSNSYINRWNAEFKTWGLQDATEAVTTSLNNGYQGIFKPRTRVAFNKYLSQQAKTSTDHAKGF
jgi:hypothetical protein